MALSVVIPTLNEAAVLAETLRHVRAVPEVVQVIVADGGSTDGTRQIAEVADAIWVGAPRGRGSQCRAGAEQATGTAIVFVHADTWLPSDAGAAISRALSADMGPGRVVAGGFRKRFHDAPLSMRGARFRSWLWFRLSGRLFGDQAIFVRRESLEAIGGFPDSPLMEEFELVRRLERLGRIVLLDSCVTASARRFRKHGVLATYLRMAEVLWGHSRGVPADELRRRYEQR